jgi:hypothetical protein
MDKYYLLFSGIKITPIVKNRCGGVLDMEKDKHVMPNTNDAFSQRVKKNAGKNYRVTKTVYGPENEPMSKVNMEISRELTDKKQKH